MVKEVFKTKIRPLRDHVVLLPEEVPNKVGEIFIPTMAEDSIRNKTGGYLRVIAAGPLVEHAKVGKRVHVGAYGHHWAGVEVRDQGKLVVVIRERDLNGVVVE